MPQAKRKSPTYLSNGKHQSFNGLLMLLVGMVIGSLATILWQGMQTADGGVGTGIRQMIEQSKHKDQGRSADEKLSEEDKPVKQQTNFDFFTVLPEIEIVVPTVDSDPPLTEEKSEVDPQVTVDVQDKPDSSYMLQVGSYKNKAEADRLKASLALKGLVSSIQKVTIQGKGDFFRVRLGPYISYSEMAQADDKLAEQGIKTLRLKISNGG